MPRQSITLSLNRSQNVRCQFGGTGAASACIWRRLPAVMCASGESVSVHTRATAQATRRRRRRSASKIWCLAVEKSKQVLWCQAPNPRPHSRANWRFGCCFGDGACPWGQKKPKAERASESERGEGSWQSGAAPRCLKTQRPRSTPQKNIKKVEGALNTH